MGPGPDRWSHVHRWGTCRECLGGHLRELGPPREDPDHKPLELRVVEVGGQCHARTACEQHELHFTALRKDWRRCDRGLACDRGRFSDWIEVLGCFCWLRWLVLPERYTQSCIHLREGGFARGGQVLADGCRHERAPEDRLHQQDHLQPLQHRHEQENCSAWFCLQEGYRGCARDTSGDGV